MRSFRTFLFCVFLVLPLSLHAQRVTVDRAIFTPDPEVVSRGEFIRAAVQLLEVKTSGDDVSLPYQRVPKALQEYVETAYDEGALEHFGNDLLLARGITRGQALQVLVALMNASTPKPVEFNDLEIGTAEEKAVRVAVELQWMEPLRPNLFGVRRMLTGKEGRLLMRKVLGEGGTPSIQTPTKTIQTPTIRVQFTTGEKRKANLPKTQMLETVWDIINREFLYSDQIDPDAAAWAALEGIVKSLGDPYTSFLKPITSRNFQTQIQGEVSGIGAQVEDKDGILTIVSPLVGSPAERSGLKPGDQIFAVDGESIIGLGFLEAVDRVRGPKGSTVTLRIRRNGIEQDIDVTRDVIRVPEAIITWQGDIAVVRLTQFGKLTENDLRGELLKINSENPKGIILDLRNNPGGLLSAATKVVGFFTPKGTETVEIKSRDAARTDTTKEDPVMGDLPLAILVNGGSASASEIVAGALQDHGRGQVVGEKTFGKGTVQEVLQFNDQSSLKMTIAEWFTPKGRKINGMGITPDIIVEENDERDEPMLKALEILR